MSSRYTRAILCGTTAMRQLNKQQVRKNSQMCIHGRSLSLAAAARQQLAIQEALLPGQLLRSATTGRDSLVVQFGDGSARECSYTWLRENCRCSKCIRAASSLPSTNSFDHHQAHPEIIQSNDFGLVVDWSDGHISKYSGEWLYRQACNTCDG